ncbi:DUF4430 domain-containing protein [Lentilactobacillus otakiensis]|uniref:DUF4430 domain-containing protein n=1 Tax=Lentilactobacillus otakiensis TaxID=481720 RepID=UPI003D17CDCE
MKKAIGIVIGVILVLGLAFGIREVVANRAQQHARTEKVAKMDSGSQPKVTTSSTASSQKPKTKKSTTKKSQSHQPTANKRAKSPNTASPSATSSSHKKSAGTHPVSSAKQTSSVTPRHSSKKAQAKQKASPKYTGKAYLKVSGYKKLFYSGNLHITKKTTAFTLLQQTNLKITYTSSPAIYVSAINGLKENDIKVGSGWMYSVNGKYVDKSAGDKLIKPGDKVHWYFTVQGFK